MPAGQERPDQAGSVGLTRGKGTVKAARVLQASWEVQEAAKLSPASCSSPSRSTREEGLEPDDACPGQLPAGGASPLFKNMAMARS